MENDDIKYVYIDGQPIDFILYNKIKIKEWSEAMNEAYKQMEEIICMADNGEEGNIKITIAQCNRLIFNARDLVDKCLREYESMYDYVEAYKEVQKELADKEIQEYIKAATVTEKSWIRKADVIMNKAAREHDLIMNGIDETEVLIKMGERGFSKEKLEEYINGFDIPHFKDKISFLKKHMKFEREEMGAITIKNATDLNKMHTYDSEKMKSICTAYFELVCENIISASHKNGLEESVKKMMELKDKIEVMMCSIGLSFSESYMNSKLELLRTTYAYEEYKIRQKEERERERERIREEEKAQREYERERQTAEKDEATARRKIEETQRKLAEEKGNQKKYEELQARIAELNEALQIAIQRQERAISMAQQTKHGFVYVISNIGSFGENIFKIGLTRRLDPTERIDELSNASVPFPFDIHAMIESENAPALEAALHQAFSAQKINKMNWRKEFFNVSLEEIEKAVKKSGIDATFIKDASAQQYRDSLFYEKL